MSTDYSLLADAPLLARNTFRVAARAAFLADLREPAGLPELLELARSRGLPLLVLGEGSNLLFAADFPGLIVSVAVPGVSVLEDAGDRVRVRARAAENWNDFVRWTLARGLAGLENLSLIPGSVGAAPIQNIGAYGAEVGEYITSVEAFDRLHGEVRRLSHDACAFGYRDSVFKREAERWIVLAVDFDLPREAPLRLDYAGVREELAAMGIDVPGPSSVAEAVSRLRTRKLPNPALLGNAGSFFKNPVVDAARAQALCDAHAGLPVFATPEGSKLSAAWLIEQCGWKGHREGDAGVSAQHALVLVNHGAASGAQLLELAARVRDSVNERFGVRLEPEPRIIGGAL